MCEDGEVVEEVVVVEDAVGHAVARLAEDGVRLVVDLRSDADDDPLEDDAEDQRAPNVGGLVVTDARVDGGPMFKRMRPRARGMAFMIKKRTSHIHVAVEAPELN